MHNYESAEEWFDRLRDIAASHDNASAVRDFQGWTEDWESQTPEEAYYAEYPEHQ